ncbi:hypothetical protein L7F22_005607 [Adiantum nelumboides]|nr:hypothetical protein [Adiantum nelumboides]
MNEFLACVWRGRTIDTYYEEFLKLSRYAPLITEEQNLSRFILGWERKLADEVEALRPTSLADALIRAKPKFSSSLKSNNQQGEQKREQSYHFESSHKPQKFQSVAKPVNQLEVQPVRVNALPITQGGRPIHCFECGQEGHKKMHCPQQRQNKGFQYQNRWPQQQNPANSNHNRNQRIPNGFFPVNRMHDSRGIRRNEESSDLHFPIIGHGLRNRNSFFTDFFEKDPFDDPFFTQPFGSLFPSRGEFSEPLPHRQSRGPFDRRFQEQQGSSGVVIEELADDHEDAKAARPRSDQEPIVEHLDDIAQQDNLVHHSDGLKRFTQSFTFSSVTYEGPQGTYYKSSAMRRAGGDGLFEEVREEKDSINGNEINEIRRGVGNKGHGVTRKKSATGKEDYKETLHNLTKGEKREFDETWKKQAKKYLPGFSKSHGMILKINDSEQESSDSVDSSSSAKPAKQLTWRWPWAKKA